MKIQMKKVMTLHVKLGESKVVGETGSGQLAVIPITGGTFEGPGLQGRICPGGADWNTRVSENLCHVCARYWLETEDGEIISVVNEGWLDPTDEAVMLKTTPRFTCNQAGCYAHLAKGTYAGELTGGGENGVDIVFWQLP